MVTFILSAFWGFIIAFFFSHPTHPISVKRRVPSIRIKWIQFTPNLKINLHSYEIHIHHWIHILVIYITLTVYPGNLLDSHMAIQGFLLGGVGQGLLYRDRFSIIKPAVPRSLAYIVYAGGSLNLTTHISSYS